MSLAESLLYSLIGILTVFSVLCILYVVIVIQGNIFSKKPALSAAPAVEIPQKEEAPTAELKLIDVDESTAAMIMAIVADETKIPVNQLYFKSIKYVGEVK